MNHTFRPSPNYDERNAKIEHIILHYTGMKSGKEAIERLCNPGAKVSSHYVIEEDGKLYQLVDESKRAWHAGISYWRGKENLNASSIGIEIVNCGHEFGYHKFTEAQYETLIPLCQRIKKDYSLQDVNIVAHSDIAPGRKQDPGELFDWERLAHEGVGLWPISRIENRELRTESPTPNLHSLGYHSHDIHSIMAFQRHWRQKKVDGVWDKESCEILANLLELVGR